MGKKKRLYRLFLSLASCLGFIFIFALTSSNPPHTQRTDARRLAHYCSSFPEL